MALLVVVGNANVETRVPVGNFPVGYEKVRYVPNGIRMRTGGVGANVARSASALGVATRLLAMGADDGPGAMIRAELAREGVSTLIHPGLAASPASVVLESADGAGAIFTDLKAMYEAALPPALVDLELRGASALHATNIGWALEPARQARAMGLRVSTDVQALGGGPDAYNDAFAAVANVILFSGERLGDGAREEAARLLAISSAEVVVCGLGAKGALAVARDGTTREVPSRASGAPAGATGAGDAMAGTFVGALAQGLGWERALDVAQAAAAAWIVEGRRVSMAEVTASLPEMSA